MRHRGRDATVIVTGDDEHAAVRRRPIGVAVLQRVAGPVDPGTLAVPHPENALRSLVRVGLDLLRAQHRCRRKVLVHRRQELDALILDQLLGAPELQVDAAERRAAIAGDEAGGLEPVGLVAACLIDCNTHQRLGSGDEYGPG
jgi:hypothetical protein